MSTVAVVVALGMVLTAAPPAPMAVAAPEPPCTTAEKSVAAAAATAKRCNVKVEISTLRSTTDQTFARPAGGFTTEQSVEPRWTKKSDGTWAAIDTTLRTDATGAVTPVASALPVVFSGGGTGPVAVLSEVDRELALTATMPVKVGGGELAVTPSATMMADRSTRFPVFIDPSWTGHIQDNAWTMVMGRPRMFL